MSGRVMLLLSGGMDSVALAYWRRPAIALTIDYGQLSAEGEIRAAATVATELALEHEVLRIDARSLGSGDLAGSAALPMAPVSEWWPFRNQLLATIGAARALVHKCDRVWLGSVSTDSAHADGTKDFFEQLDRLVALQEGGVRVEAPALHLSTVDLVGQSKVPSSLLAWAHSCHTSDFACGVCRGCAKSLEVRAAVWGAEYAIG